MIWTKNRIFWGHDGRGNADWKPSYILRAPSKVLDALSIYMSIFLFDLGLLGLEWIGCTARHIVRIGSNRRSIPPNCTYIFWSTWRILLSITSVIKGSCAVKYVALQLGRISTPIRYRIWSEFIIRCTSRSSLRTNSIEFLFSKSWTIPIDSSAFQ